MTKTWNILTKHILLFYNLLIIKTVKKDKRKNNSVKDFGYFPSVTVKKQQLQNLIYNLSTDLKLEIQVIEFDSRGKALKP